MASPYGKESFGVGSLYGGLSGADFDPRGYQHGLGTNAYHYTLDDFATPDGKLLCPKHGDVTDKLSRFADSNEQNVNDRLRALGKNGFGEGSYNGGVYS